MGKKSFAQRVQLRKIGMVVLFFGIVVGLTACVAFWQQGPVAVLRITSPSPMDMFEVPLTVRFDISKSHAIGQDLTRFELDFGDETAAVTGNDFKAPITHIYRVAGVFYAVLTVTDAAGATGRTEIRIDTLPVHVYFSRDNIIHRVRVHDGYEEIPGAAVKAKVESQLSPSLIPNTRDRIAFTGGVLDIWTMRTDGRLPAQLTHTADFELQPTWSHDGDTIAYARIKDGLLWEIWTMTAAGANQTVLITQTPSHVWAPAFSPINNDLVFVKQTGANPSELWIRRADGTLEVLYSVPGIRVGDPTTITAILAILRAMPPHLRELLERQPVPVTPPYFGISQPRWSPDGTKIVFAREREQAVGTPATIGPRLLPGPIIIPFPRPRPISDIWVLTVPLRGAAVVSETLEEYVRRRVYPNDVPVGTITTAYHEFSPHWLEDGNIVFIRETAIEGPFIGVFHLYHVDLRTGALRRLTEVSGALMPARR